MRAVVQRVAAAAVKVDGAVVGAIEEGLLVLLGVAPGDGGGEVEWMVRKLAGLRIFRDANDLMNRSVRDVDGSVLVISQFTLYGDCKRGNRPSFIGAAQPEEAEKVYVKVVEGLAAALGPEKVATGKFGAAMSVELVNDGPVTLILETS